MVSIGEDSMDRRRFLHGLAAVAAGLPSAGQAVGRTVAPLTERNLPDGMREEMRRNLRRDILDPWFPRAVDRTHGGFHQNYAEDWSPRPDADRALVYQSRLTWVAAQAAARFPDEYGAWKSYALHGVDYLAGPLHDPQHGGWFWAVAVEGSEARSGGEKHAYGIAFGIYASAAAYRATKERRALDLALDAFRWLERHAHDREHGGYYEALTRKGSPMLEPPGPERADPIGTEYGHKSMNTHIHLLEAFTELFAAAPHEPRLRERLAEIFDLVRDRVCQPSGYLAMFFQPDWTPVPGLDSFGHDVETAFLLLEAAHALGDRDPRTWQIARSLVDHALHFGWDAQRGGFYDSGHPEGAVTRAEKIWWTQAEGLNALHLMEERYGREDARYGRAFREQWEFIRRFQVDPRYRGWYSEVSQEGRPHSMNKSDPWKDPYHQGRALLRLTAEA